jgi:hypothetical protein
MGILRKTASLSTLGGVKYTSRREAETKERLAQARLAKAQAKAAARSPIAPRAPLASVAAPPARDAPSAPPAPAAPVAPPAPAGPSREAIREAKLAATRERTEQRKAATAAMRDHQREKHEARISAAQERVEAAMRGEIPELKLSMRERTMLRRAREEPK